MYNRGHPQGAFDYTKEQNMDYIDLIAVTLGFVAIILILTKEKPNE